MQVGNLIYRLLMQDSSEGNVSLKFAFWEVWDFLLCFGFVLNLSYFRRLPALRTSIHHH